MSGSIEDQSLSFYLKRLTIVQIFLAYVFLVTGLCVNLLQLLSACFIWPFNRGLYRKINYHLATIIWSPMTFVYQWWSNSDLIVYIKPEDLEKMRQENSIWLGNHRYEVDWLLGWVVTQRLGLAGGSKILGKQSLRLLPIIGWCWYFTESIFLRRVWSSDKAVLERDLKRLVDDYPKDYNFTLFLSCEGTRYSNEKRLDSMKIAREKGLPELKHHILPRTKGFVLIMKGIHQHVTAVYDITIAFQTPKNPELSNLLIGQRCQAEGFIRRIPISEVPYDDEEKSAQFVHKLFQEKDQIFEYFLQHGTFEGAGNPKAIDLKRKKQDLIIEISCLIIIGLPSIYLLIKFLLFGSILSQIIFLFIVMAGFVGVRLMVQTSARPKLANKSAKQE
ncbi:unnamed protein product [Rotaria socialis]|uniref:Phospholipid/glycerol acyltransferase domain-containing protein n=1 Tax=Rotaria socialis TaxID=392032 RepID=A0A817X0F8_9BILA|nr:unnamed protein product [Rotaria socialis]CAF3369831.1 unnamed protein product [Rotaria socialis]CAF3421824.1 unnamed protein product [Rotaria socialis]CAF3424742.1 unnamed protein product [Rotaria socialis]CAF3720265.1 unnamed protein product [Rotaria socialis]